MIFELWDELPWYGRIVVFALVPLYVLMIVGVVVWAVVS